MADVFLGGVQGFSSLAITSASVALNATGRIGLYQHANGVQNAYVDGSLAKIVQAFAGDGSGVAELPFVSDPTTWFSEYYDQVLNNTAFAQSLASLE